MAADAGDLWNSGKVSGGQSGLVAYGGAPLRSRARCYCKVQTWTNQGESGWRAPARWRTGLQLLPRLERPLDWPRPRLCLRQGGVARAAVGAVLLQGVYRRQGGDAGHGLHHRAGAVRAVHKWAMRGRPGVRTRPHQLYPGREVQPLRRDGTVMSGSYCQPLMLRRQILVRRSRQKRLFHCATLERGATSRNWHQLF